MLWAFVRRVRGAAIHVVRRVRSFVSTASQPAPVLVGLLGDIARSREELVAENALLRHQLVVVARTIKRPKLAAHDRGLMVVLARLVPRWWNAVLLVKPDTILRWHREGYRADALALGRLRREGRLVRSRIISRFVGANRSDMPRIMTPCSPVALDAPSADRMRAPPRAAACSMVSVRAGLRAMRSRFATTSTPAPCSRRLASAATRAGRPSMGGHPAPRPDR